MMFRPKWLVIHHTQGWKYNTTRELRMILDARGLKGYQWVQYADSTDAWRMASMYRGDMPGGHAAKHNSEAVGYAFIGNFQDRAPDDARLKAAAVDCAVLLRLYGLTPVDIIAHRDVPQNDTDCPGVAFTRDLFERFRTMVSEQFHQAD